MALLINTLKRKEKTEKKEKRKHFNSGGIAGGSINDGTVRWLVFMLRSVGFVPPLILLNSFLFVYSIFIMVFSGVAFSNFEI